MTGPPRVGATPAVTRCPRVSLRRAGVVGLAWIVPLVALGGCFLVPWSPERPDARSVSGPVVYVEGCETCHAAPVGASYARSLHAAKGIRCGQCHTGAGHPDFVEPVADTKCGGCHQAEYQQTLASRHFATRARRALDADRAARVALREKGFVAATAGGRHFVGDAVSGERGGRLCAACHYDEHRLGLGAVQREDFCVGCHADRAEHFPSPDPTNRCVQCHVRVGETVNSQVVNTHRFVRP
jgi:hypothetical protein